MNVHSTTLPYSTKGHQELELKDTKKSNSKHGRGTWREGTKELKGKAKGEELGSTNRKCKLILINIDYLLYTHYHWAAASWLVSMLLFWALDSFYILQSNPVWSGHCLSHPVSLNSSLTALEPQWPLCNPKMLFFPTTGPLHLLFPMLELLLTFILFYSSDCNSNITS